MNIKQGYKQTEIGIIPDDWEVSTLGKCLKNFPVYGINAASIPFDSRFPTYLRITDINEDGYFIDSNKTSVNHAMANSYILESGDIVFARTGASVGKSYAYDEKDGELVFAGFLIKISPDVDQLIPTYLKFYAKTDFYWNWIKMNSMRSGQPGINSKEYASLPIPLPPLPEQTAIATALSDIDALIGELDKLIAKKQGIKQATMQQLLTGKKRLAGFSGEWEVKRFSELFDYLPTATNSRADLSESGNVYYIHYGDIHTRFHSHLNFKEIQPPKIEQFKCENAAFIQNGDWIMADASEDFDGIGKSIEILGLDETIKAVAGLHTFLLREKRPVFAPMFKGHLGNLKSLHEQFLRVATGMKVYGVSKTALKDLILTIPNYEEQTAIANILSDMDAEISQLEGHRAKMGELKQGMMQELLTGRIRLNTQDSTRC